VIATAVKRSMEIYMAPALVKIVIAKNLKVW
jgi:hypothetical protein